MNQAFTPLKDRLTRQRTLVTDRVIEPNWLTPEVPRYCLENYRRYCTNKISTTKYTWMNFIFKNLWEQFHRWANIYFCVIAGLNWIPQLQAVSRYIGMIPVAIILAATAIKDFAEDWRRRKADKRVNRNTVHVWDSSKRRFRKTWWELVLVGDLVHVSCDEKIPADIVLIRSSDPQGMAFVETSNLDGENNLKQKIVLPGCRNYCRQPKFNPEYFNVNIFCSQPDNRLNHISGTVKYDDGTVDTLSRDNVILRGCQIRNTAFVEGVVLYTVSDGVQLRPKRATNIAETRSNCAFSERSSCCPAPEATESMANQAIVVAWLHPRQD
ncbi:TAT-4.1 protein [Aphelenchoides avenae]|nr:TAT-4.1 protein [Aphelenchus avenae]